MVDYRSGPAARHYAYISRVERRPEEEVEEVVYSLLSYQPGVGLICRSLDVKYRRRSINDIKSNFRWPAGKSAPRRLSFLAAYYEGRVEYAMRVGDGPGHHTAEDVEEAFAEDLKEADEDEDLFMIKLTDLPGDNPNGDRPGWDPEGFIRLVEIYRPVGDRDGIYDADDLGREQA